MEMHMTDLSTNPDLNLAGVDPVDDCECLHPASVMRARRDLGDAPPAESVAGIFGILGDPTRIRVLVALSGGEMCVTDLAAATNVNRTTISHQLRVLRAHRLVRRRRDGKVMYYALDDDHVTALLAMAAVHVTEEASAKEAMPA
jgi:DNA-binding transcriptional ArsR family regulator